MKVINLSSVDNSVKLRFRTAPNVPIGDITYIGRGSIWGNPYGVTGMKSKFPITYLPTLEDVLMAYEQHVRNSPSLISKLNTLRGQRLACFCAPRPCHGDVLIRLVEEYAVGGEYG